MMRQEKAALSGRHRKEGCQIKGTTRKTRIGNSPVFFTDFSIVFSSQKFRQDLTPFTLFISMR